MNDVKKIISKLTRSEIAKKLGVGVTAIINAENADRFPAAWYPTVKKLAAEKGVDVSDNLFNWRQSPDGERREVRQ